MVFSSWNGYDDEDLLHRPFDEDDEDLNEDEEENDLDPDYGDEAYDW